MSPDRDEDARTLLLVDDDAIFRRRLARAFAERGFRVREAADGASALAAARDESPELAVVDLRMPGVDGLEVVRGLKAIDPTTQVVVLTGYGSIATALEAVRLGAAHYLTKPADVDDVLAAFARGETTDGGEPLPERPVPSLARVEWEHISRVLADCDGNVSRAARLLGIHRRSLQRKLAKFPVPR
jgi:two-component system response regulator RegA